MVLMASKAVQGVWTVSECARMIINRYQRAGSVCVSLDDFVIGLQPDCKYFLKNNTS